MFLQNVAARVIAPITATYHEAEKFRQPVTGNLLTRPLRYVDRAFLLAAHALNRGVRESRPPRGEYRFGNSLAYSSLQSFMWASGGAAVVSTILAGFLSITNTALRHNPERIIPTLFLTGAVYSAIYLYGFLAEQLDSEKASGIRAFAAMVTPPICALWAAIMSDSSIPTCLMFAGVHGLSASLYLMDSAAIMASREP